MFTPSQRSDTKTNTTIMENFNQFKVSFERNEKPIIMLIPMWDINDVHEHIWDVVGKRPRSLSRL